MNPHQKWNWWSSPYQHQEVNVGNSSYLFVNNYLNIYMWILMTFLIYCIYVWHCMREIQITHSGDSIALQVLYWCRITINCSGGSNKQVFTQVWSVFMSNSESKLLLVGCLLRGYLAKLEGYLTNLEGYLINLEGYLTNLGVIWPTWRVIWPTRSYLANLEGYQANLGGYLANLVSYLFYHANVVMLFRSQTSFLYYFLFLYKFKVLYIIQKVLANKNKLNWIVIY